MSIIQEKLSPQEHENTGHDLRVIRNYLMGMSLRLADSYGKRSQARLRADRACYAIDKLRSELDGLMFQDLSNSAPASAYYGNSLENQKD